MNATLVLLNLADFLLTALLICRYGELAEANPVALCVYRCAGFAGMFALKTVSVAVTISIIEFIRHAGRVWTANCLWLLAVTTVSVAVLLGIISHA